MDDLSQSSRSRGRFCGIQCMHLMTCSSVCRRRHADKAAGGRKVVLSRRHRAKKLATCSEHIHSAASEPRCCLTCRKCINAIYQMFMTSNVIIARVFSLDSHIYPISFRYSAYFTYFDQ